MKHKKLSIALMATAAAAGYSAPAMAQAEPFIGQLMLFGGNFCPRGWSTAAGQILSIAQNTALFSLLGTTYGGNGQTTFALPDLRGRVALSQGQGPGLSNYVEGQTAGTETVTLTINQMPTHTHTAALRVLTVDADKPGAAHNAFAKAAGNTYSTQSVSSSTNYMDAGTVMVGTAGGNQPFQILQPYQVLQWCIALEGIFPSRN